LDSILKPQNELCRDLSQTAYFSHNTRMTITKLIYFGQLWNYSLNLLKQKLVIASGAKQSVMQAVEIATSASPAENWGRRPRNDNLNPDFFTPSDPLPNSSVFC